MGATSMLRPSSSQLPEWPSSPSPSSVELDRPPFIPRNSNFLRMFTLAFLTPMLVKCKWDIPDVMPEGDWWGGGILRDQKQLESRARYLLSWWALSKNVQDYGSTKVLLRSGTYSPCYLINCLSVVGSVSIMTRTQKCTSQLERESRTRKAHLQSSGN